jgi:uncharacterized hydrophobic protein (TIGR00341 family)
MSSRLIEVFLPCTEKQRAENILSNYKDLETWYETLTQEQLLVRIFADTSQVETLVDQLAEALDGVKDYRLLLLEVEAALPNAELDRDASLKQQLAPDVDTELNPRKARLNREEIYDRVADSGELSWTQLAMVVLSTAIATIGILRDNQAVVIGAMVIAPLLKPNMALAVATTLGDFSFALRTFRTGLVGILVSLALSITVGFVVSVSPESTEISSRIQAGWSDGILAFASGMAGAISLTTEERSSIVGVMVSVALLPPLVVLGLLLGAGYWSAAFGSALLVVTNLICLNLAAVTTFIAQNLRPRQQQDVPKAKQFTFAAYGIWLLLLGGLVGVGLMARFHEVSFF